MNKMEEIKGIRLEIRNKFMDKTTLEREIYALEVKISRIQKRVFT